MNQYQVDHQAFLSPNISDEGPFARESEHTYNSHRQLPMEYRFEGPPHRDRDREAINFREINVKSVFTLN